MIEEERIQRIVTEVVGRLRAEGKIPPAPAAGQGTGSTPLAEHSRRKPADEVGGPGVFADLDEAVRAAEVARRRLAEGTLDLKRKIIQSIRDTCRQAVGELSRLAVEETGMGRVEDKVSKNLLVIEKTPGVEILVPKALTGDDGLVLTERAPWGVIGAITPCTNPTETIICNGIGMLAGGNAVVFNVHPAARKVSAFTLGLMNRAVAAAGGPENVFTMAAEPTIESAQRLMKHPGVRLLVVTGGPGVVKVAMNSGKKVIAAGPGNPPVVVDETADLPYAARNMVFGAGFDNNIICVVEKEFIVVESVADRLKAEMRAAGAVELTKHQARRLEKVVVDGEGPNKAFVGKNASVILKEIGVEAPEETRIAFVEADEGHPFVQHEMLMPVLGLVRVKNVKEAIAMAVRVEHGFRHTAVMYSNDIRNLHEMARAVDTSIFVKNAPAVAGLSEGGEGYTSFTIASPTGEGLTTAINFTRERRCTLKGAFRIV